MKNFIQALASLCLFTFLLVCCQPNNTSLHKQNSKLDYYSELQNELSINEIQIQSLQEINRKYKRKKSKLEKAGFWNGDQNETHRQSHWDKKGIEIQQLLGSEKYAAYNLYHDTLAKK